MEQRKLYMVQVIAIIDALMAVFSFSFFLILIFFMGNDDEQALMSTTNFFLVGGKEAAKNMTEANRAIFRMVFASVVVLIAMAIHTVQIFMAWILYRAVKNMKHDLRHSLKTFERWRSWSVILLILLVTGIVSFSFGLFGRTGERWIIVTFLLAQMSFQVFAIYYIGSCAVRQRSILEGQGSGCRSLSVSTITDQASSLNITGGNDKVDWKILYDL